MNRPNGFSQFPGSEEEWLAAGFVPDSDYPLLATPYYAGLVRAPDSCDPVARQLIPRAEESTGGGAIDPLDEARFRPLPGLVHVYQDRLLLLPTSRCAVNCRHCNRRWLRRKLDNRPEELLPGWLDYLRTAPGVREVLLTGGDPLTLPPELIGELIDRVRELRPGMVIRIGSRLPVVAPERLGSRWTATLRRRLPLYFHTQFNCPAECTAEAGAALLRLVRAGLNPGNQMVLLRGVNDDAAAIAAVNRWLVAHGCRPYYLFFPEPVAGTGHFGVPPERALAIGLELRRELSGLALPRMVVDTPAGGGKIPLLSEAVRHTDDGWQVTDVHGRRHRMG